MSVREAYAEGAVDHDLAGGEVRRVDVVIAFHDLEVWREGAEKFVCWRIGKIP